MSSDSCATSGCHGGAGLNRGASHIWSRSDPHSKSAATLTNGQSEAIARKIGIKSAAESQSCTVCHAPMKHVAADLFMPLSYEKKQVKEFSCANCHGGAEKWILSHTRPEYPRAALEKLGMRPLGSAYQRANACVACHQNLSDELTKANHPPLLFELDGLLVEEPKHWREDADFSHAKTWLVGQAVALREASAQAAKQPGAARTAEIEALQELLVASAMGFEKAIQADLVRFTDDFAKKISAMPMTIAQTKSLLAALLRYRRPFELGAFQKVPEPERLLAVGHYAERVALGIDRLNQSLIASGESAAVNEDALNELFKAAQPPKTFDADIADNFLRKLDLLVRKNE